MATADAFINPIDGHAATVVRWDGLNFTYATIQQMTSRRCELNLGELFVWVASEKQLRHVHIGEYVVRVHSGFIVAHETTEEEAARA